MKFYLTGLGNLAESKEHIISSVTEADRLGFDGALMPDHYMWGQEIGHNMKNPYSTLETWTTLTYLAGKTERISLGTLVTPLGLRHPGILAKMLSTLDILSGGRVVLGVGAGWSEVEFKGYSEWLKTGDRVDKTSEALEVILRLWTEPSVTHIGEYYHLDGAVLEPKPIQRPHPRLLFGSQGARMLNITGKFGDICFIPPWAGSKTSEIIETVKKAAESAGRSSRISFMLGEMDTQAYGPDQYFKRIEAAEKMGAKYYTVAFPKDDKQSIKRFSEEVIPSFRN
jgi:alkanesulfonate monooxygenase SsuD/methylene tetrahydromethanopterin reductase-like flavin-dependent oxidoreductase (luciferase family)